MLTTAHKGLDRLSAVLTLAAAFALAAGGGVLYTLLIILGDCAGGGSTGCSM